MTQVNEPLTQGPLATDFHASRSVTREACVTALPPPLTNEQPSCAIFSLSRGVESSGGFVRLLSLYGVRNDEIARHAHSP
jgi:hypothetical protein